MLTSINYDTITALPVTIFEAKKQLQVTHSEDDLEIMDLIRAATEAVETRAKRIISPRDVVATYDRFPYCYTTSRMQLPAVPVNSIVVTYYDADNAIQTLDAADYIFTADDTDGQIWTSDAWPDTYCRPDAVTLTMTCGYSIAPASAKHAIKLLVSSWYENRDDTGIIGTAASSLIAQLRPKWTAMP